MSEGPDRKAAIYRLLDGNGQLLYIGVAYAPSVRVSFHRRNKPWGREIARYEVDWHPSRTVAEEAEERLIKDLWPPYNVLHTPAHRMRSVMHYPAEVRARAAERIRTDYASRQRTAELGMDRVRAHQIAKGKTSGRPPKPKPGPDGP